MAARFVILFMVVIQLCLPYVHTISFSVPRFEPGSDDIIYEGDAFPSVGAIDLTMDYYYRVGRATYAEPVKLWDSSSGELTDFNTHFSFKIDILNYTTYGHGIAFFLAPVGYQIPPNSGGGFLGLLNTTTIATLSTNQLLIVEFDTYVNPWDPPVEHVGINNNSLFSAVYAQWDVRSHSGNLTNAWITYNSTTKNLSVYWTYQQNPVFMVNMSSLSYHIDLRHILPEWVTVGFSSATGLYKSKHYINSWDFTSTLNQKAESKKKLGAKIYLLVGFPVCFILILGGMIGWFMLKKRTTQKRNKAGADLERVALPKRFSYQELALATNGFADSRRLGQGGSGLVYRGILTDPGRMVAVKRVFAGSEHPESLFTNEVRIISRLIHRNLVQFIGWCHEQGEFILVYEYMPNGSLDAHLFGSGRNLLPWNFRYNIALGLASALHYLHEGVDQCVLHRDVKPGNILLDMDFTARLGDFGIAKLLDTQLVTTTTCPVGTPGYVAPEYENDGKASQSTDMFSFGVVALEIASGKRNGNSAGLVKEVWRLYREGDILDAADDRLEMKFDVKEMTCLMMVGLWCTHPTTDRRPSAGQVIQFLKFEAAVPELPQIMHYPALPVFSSLALDPEMNYYDLFKYSTS